VIALGCALRPVTILAAAALLPATAASQAPARVDSAASVFGHVRGAFMALSVPDLAASRRWYVETLGLRPTLEPPPASGGAVVVLEGGGLIVELVQLDSAVARVHSPERTHGYFKSGIVVDDLDAVLAELRRRGVEVAYGPYRARNGERANVIIRDNAGNWIQLFGR
jgi:catechol 2,3-dioxygenase-like lactoylglutathione lyase family enzyme